MYVKAKKRLGQHFLKDQNIARKIVSSLSGDEYSDVIEVGPGMGVLTRFLMEKENFNIHVVEVDGESIVYLQEHFPQLLGKIHNKDFLGIDLAHYFPKPGAILGNFPYNISSQIFFKILENRDLVVEVVGMIQKEVAERIAAPPGSKTYGILSVYLQAFYTIEYLFTVSAHVFAPPPKVKSAVIRLRRNQTKQLDCDEALFFKVIKTAFNQRRKTISNSLKPLNITSADNSYLKMRPEQLSVNDFVQLTNWVSKNCDKN